jgi:hypothetical protein
MKLINILIIRKIKKFKLKILFISSINIKNEKKAGKLFIIIFFLSLSE